MKRIIILSLVAAIVGCSDSKPERLEDAGKNIIRINAPSFFGEADEMVIDVKANSVWGAVSSSEKIIEDFKRYFPSELNKYNKVWVLANSDLVDKYGNESVDRAFGIEWLTSDLKKTNLKSSGFNTFTLMNLASDLKTFNRAGDDSFIKYCEDKDNLRFSQRFCALYLRTYIGR